MKKLIDLMLGGSTKPAKKATAYAIIITAAVLILALLTLAISSIVFAIADGKEPAPDGEGNNNGNTVVTVEYVTANASELALKLDAAVNVRENRSSMVGGVYYATNGTSHTLASSAQKALDSMLVAFYNANKGNLVTDASNPNCNVPLVDKCDGAYSFELNGFDEKTSADKPLYSWIYTNAYRYGFVYDGNVFHYVGAASATYAKSNGAMGYSAYMNALRGASKELSAEVGETGYLMYYLANGAEYKVPANLPYTVIGNATSGYIVTVTIK